MNYSTLLFDVDDTLLDFQLAEKKALDLLFEDQQIELTEDIRTTYKKMNLQLWSLYEQGKMTRSDVIASRFSQLFLQLGKDVDGAMMDQRYRYFLSQGHELVENSKEIVADLATKADLYIVTNGVSETQYKRLEASKLRPYFKEIFVSEDTGYQKPMKEYFDFVFARIPNIDKQKTVIIGDSLTSDIAGGNRAGIDTIWFNRNQLPEEKTIRPTYKIDKLNDLYKIL